MRPSRQSRSPRSIDKFTPSSSLGPPNETLTDIRLVLGSRLDVTEDLEDRWAKLGPDDPMAPLLAAYEWLGWLQESVVLALDD